MSDKKEPLLLRPSGKDYLWGGKRLNDEFEKGIDLTPLAETWECSTHPDGPCYVVDGAFDGRELAEVLKAIANEGSAVFYSGWIAQEIAQASGMRLSDLSGYETQVSDAVTGEYNGYTIASASAPFSGITLIQILKLCEILELPNPTENPKGYLETLTNVIMAFVETLAPIEAPTNRPISIKMKYTAPSVPA